VPKCAVFQIFAHVFALGDKDYNDWNCKGIDFSVLPETLNTVDLLGQPGQAKALAPEVVVSQLRLLAPDSSENDVHDTVSFYVDFDYFLRLSLQPQGASGMKAVVRQGNSVIAKAGGAKARGADVSLGVELKQSLTYSLEIYHYPHDPTECSTYAFNLEMRLRNTINRTRDCEFLPPGGSIVHERQAGLPTYMFDYSDMDGVSTQALDPVFSYPTSSKPFTASVPFSISAERAVVSGYLQSSFVESGLILEVADAEGVVAKGRYDNAHRFELAPVELPAGDYTVTIREATNATSSGLCVTYSAFLLTEDAGTWDNYDSLLRKTKSCKQIDQASTLNTVGQLQDGQLHWRKQIPLNVIVGLNFYELTVKEQSVLRVQIQQLQDVVFSLAVFSREPQRNLVMSQDLSSTTDVLDGLLSPGDYVLEVTFQSETQLPSVKQCPSIIMAVQVLPSRLHRALSAIATCTSSDHLPSSLSSSYSGSFKLNSADPASSEISVVVAEESEIVFQASYEELLSGGLSLRLMNEDDQVVTRGFSVENYSELREVVPAGSYKIVLETPKSSMPGVCYSLGLVFTVDAADPKQECLGAELPTKLWVKGSEAFGGPQAKDGQISFYGQFKVSEATSDTVAFKVTENSLFRALFSSQALGLGLSVYDSKYSEKALAYTRKSTSSGSFIVQLKPQTDPYLLVISNDRQGVRTGCHLFDLKVALEPIDTTQTRLECRAPEQLSYLPPTGLEFKGSKLYEGTYYIFDQWVIKDTDLPPGVKSNGKANEPFTFEMSLSFTAPGVLSSYALFDFMTNDITMLLRKDADVVTTSEWDLWSQDAQGKILADEKQSFAQGFDGAEVEAGDYTLTLKQSIASNHLVQIFKDLDICFPFSLAIEYEPIENVQTHNRLLIVEPEQSPKLNPNDKLLIVLKFEHALAFASKTLSGVAYLQSTSGLKVPPSKSKVDPRQNTHLVLEFEALVEGTCYELIFDFSAAPLTSEALPLASDGYLHSYCTAKCRCNPKAQARCDDHLQCVCPFPFSGPLCYECDEGFQNDKNRCVPVSAEEDQGDPLIAAVTPEGGPVTVHREDDIVVQVTLTSRPHTAEGEFITATRNLDAILGTFLLELQLKTHEQYRPSKATTTRDFLVWTFTFKAVDLAESVIYKLTVLPDLINDAQGRPFKLDVDLPSFMVVEFEERPDACSGRGTWSNKGCDCYEGFAGVICQSCDDGWSMDNAGYCEAVEVSLAETQPTLVSVSPPKARYQVSRGELVTAEVKLSTKPCTVAKSPINNTANTKHFKEAFYLHRTGKQTDVRLQPKAVTASADSLSWSLSFNTEALQEGVYYRLTFKPEVLFDCDGSPFASQVAMPSFGILEEKEAEAKPEPAKTEPPTKTECSNGIYYRGECVCDIGYSGLNCKDCDADFIKDDRGRCQRERKEEKFEGKGSFVMTLLNTVLIVCLCFIALYLVVKYRQRDQAKKVRPTQHLSFELDESEGGIDLHSRQFDEFKFELNLEDEDEI
jgi:hypothetical protein